VVLRIPLFVVVSALPLFGFSSEPMVSVRSELRDGSVYVETEATIAATFETIWEALTDYDRLSTFIPGMKSSRLLRYEGSTAFVEQKGSAKFLFFELPIEVVVRSIEDRPHTIRIELEEGTLERLSGGYQLRNAGRENLWKLSWSGYIEPSMPIPNFLTERLIRNDLRAQFEGMVIEIQRRTEAIFTRDRESVK
jgi:carbon monoxide dehydrogenase subunit G